MKKIALLSVLALFAFGATAQAHCCLGLNLSWLGFGCCKKVCKTCHVVEKVECNACEPVMVDDMDKHGVKTPVHSHGYR